jgi:hypothetical protein
MAIKGGCEAYCTIFELFWMSILIGWCFKWMWWMHLSPSRIRPSSRNLMRQDTICFWFSFLSTLSMLNSCLYSLVIIPYGESCMLFFCPWAYVKVIRLLGLFLFMFIFMPCKLLLLFFFMSFPSLVDYIHIFNHVSLVPLAFDHSLSQLALRNLVM